MSKYESHRGLPVTETFRDAIMQSAEELKAVKRVLLVPPDITRYQSLAGLATNEYYHVLTAHGVWCDVMPALGTHIAMTPDELTLMFGDIPHDRFYVHDWRGGVRRIGEIDGEFIRGVSDGLLSYTIAVEMSETVLRYDRIICLGQVVPHEVAGLSSHLKHLFVGCGGGEMIHRTHFLGAVYGMERMMGRADTPVRAVFDEAWLRYSAKLPAITYFLTVLGTVGGKPSLCGLYIGDDRRCFEQAAALCGELNITRLGSAPKTVVAYMDPSEYRTTWLANKAIYRTRMAIADGGRLIVLAGGVRAFGEDAGLDGLIRRFGYRGRDATLAAVDADIDLKNNLSAAAHLIHGSSDGRFEVTYATSELSRDDIEGVGFSYMPYSEAFRKYNPDDLCDGMNTVDGEDIFFIRNPAMGLWSS